MSGVLNGGKGHLYEGVKLANGRNILGDEAPQRRLQLHLLRLVALDVLKKITHFGSHVEVLVVLGVVLSFQVLVALLRVALRLSLAGPVLFSLPFPVVRWGMCWSVLFLFTLVIQSIIPINDKTCG